MKVDNYLRRRSSFVVVRRLGITRQEIQKQEIQKQEIQANWRQLTSANIMYSYSICM